MTVVRPGADLVRLTDLAAILRALRSGHPHVVGQGYPRRFVEGQRIAHALHMEARHLDYCLVARIGSDCKPRCGVLVAVPRSQASGMFASYGPTPMFFGFLFGFASYDDFRAVFDEVLALAAEAGRTALFGPFEITINQSLGLAEGPSPFPPSLLMPENPVEWNAWFERFGLRACERLFNYEIDYGRVDFSRIGVRAADQAALRIEVLAPPMSEAQKRAITEVFNSGWSRNWGFVPIDDAGVADLEREFKPLLWQGLSYVAWLNDRPAAIVVAIPDLNEVFRTPSLFGVLTRAWRMLVRKRAGTVKVLILGLARELHGSARGLAILGHILEASRTAAERHGVTSVHMGWTLESNRPVNRLINAWAPNAKRSSHRVWRYDLYPPPV